MIDNEIVMKECVPYRFICRIVVKCDVLIRYINRFHLTVIIKDSIILVHIFMFSLT